MPGMARLTDLHFNPNDCCGCTACCHVVVGPAVTGSPDVFANDLNSLRKDFTDMGVHCCCCGPNIWGTMMGSGDVFINDIGSVRLGDTNWCCGGVGTIITSSSDVFVN